MCFSLPFSLSLFLCVWFVSFGSFSAFLSYRFLRVFCFFLFVCRFCVTLFLSLFSSSSLFGFSVLFFELFFKKVLFSLFKGFPFLLLLLGDSLSPLSLSSPPLSLSAPYLSLLCFFSFYSFHSARVCQPIRFLPSLFSFFLSPPVSSLHRLFLLPPPPLFPPPSSLSPFQCFSFLYFFVCDLLLFLLSSNCVSVPFLFIASLFLPLFSLSPPFVF